MILTGLDHFLENDFKRFQNKKTGILCNQASVNKNLKHLRDGVLELGAKKIQVTCFFGPQHGIQGEKQDNMIESANFIDPMLKVPVYSLYSDTRIPRDTMLKNVEVLLIDLQDIGTRIYTFMYTMANCMIQAAKLGIKVVVLDRPNPIGGTSVEGNLLLKKFSSFVGQYPMATRHGLTMGELARYFNSEFKIHCDLEIIKCRRWKRAQTALDWKRAWTPPSPNIPRFESALVFPGTVHFEGTNISEGRGTTMPFEWIGAPFINPVKLVAQLAKHKLAGVQFRPIYFQPTYQKCAGLVCGGVQVHVTHLKKFNAFESGIVLLYEMAQMGGSKFEWKKPPYEYEYKRMPIDLISGTDEVRKICESGRGLKEFLKQCRYESHKFQKNTQPYLLYT